MLATYPEDGAGLSCTPDSPSDCGVPVDATLQLRFDRYLLPTTVVRQSLDISSGDASVFVQPRYDAVERVAVFTIPNRGIWQPGARYTVKLRSPAEDPDGWGFRAFDGAELDKGSPAPIRFTFRTRRDPTPTTEPRQAPTWDDLRALLERGGCARSSCHRSPEASMGLDLSRSSALEETAINKVAHQTENEPNAVEPLEAASRHGILMPLLDPGRPGNSYLLYKALINPDSYAGACETRHAVALDGCVAFPKEQVDELRQWFVRGSPMPLADEPPSALSLDDLRVLEDWIAAGAPLDE